MSSLQGKLLENITEKDLREMVIQREQESQILEYKREPYKRNDEETREMLRDITSIATGFSDTWFEQACMDICGQYPMKVLCPQGIMNVHLAGAAYFQRGSS